MNRALMIKCINGWNRLLHSLMIKESEGASSTLPVEPSYDTLAATLSAIPDLMFELDEHGKHYDARVLRPELLVAPTTELLGKTVAEVMPKEAANTVMQALRDAKANGHAHGSHIHLPTPLGPRWFEISIARKTAYPTEPATPQAMRFIVLSRDITERKLAHLKAEKLAYHDPLTELPNRHALQQALTERMSQQDPQSGYSALLFLDLDKFKEVNDQQGHHTGDQLLKTVAQRLRNTVRDEDMLIRWGGDEFLVLITKLSQDRAQAQQSIVGICKQLAEKVGKPYTIEHHEFTCHVSIGASLFNSPTVDIETLIQQADSAMYQAKKSKKERYALYQQKD